jgi:hypothetical protein
VISDPPLISPESKNLRRLQKRSKVLQAGFLASAQVSQEAVEAELSVKV